jgi:hypothetical protein
MPVFRGNVGNLLQHWVFCEALEAFRGSVDQIDFIDAYSMAPLADERPKLDGSAYLFDYVQRNLSRARTAYERAWHGLAPDAGHYPNSAALLTQVWPLRYSLLLCEDEPTTVNQLRMWAAGVERSDKCVRAAVAAGDWRSIFRQRLTSSGDLTFISFDPYMFDRHGSRRNAGNMNPGDLDLLNKAIETIDRRLIVQLSTYSANNANRQADVIEIVTAGVKASGLGLLGVVRADGNMMSLLLGRNVDPDSTLVTFPDRFTRWLADVKGRCQIESSGAG